MGPDSVVASARALFQTAPTDELRRLAVAPRWVFAAAATLARVADAVDEEELRARRVLPVHRSLVLRQQPNSQPSVEQDDVRLRVTVPFEGAAIEWTVAFIRDDDPAATAHPDREGGLP